jgi:hypothetical protein
MNNIQTKVPTQRKNTFLVKVLKSALRTQVGKAVAFFAGLKGFDRVQVNHYKFVREHQGEKLGFREVLIEGRVYETPKLQTMFNARVDVGAALQATLMSGTTFGSLTSPAVPKYIALSPTSLTPAHGDTTLSGETAVAGLARAAGTAQNYVAPSSLDAAASYDIYHQFTLTGTATTIVSTALFDAGSTGNMFAEVNFSSSAAMATNDILQVTWTVNI